MTKKDFLKLCLWVAAILTSIIIAYFFFFREVLIDSVMDYVRSLLNNDPKLFFAIIVGSFISLVTFIIGGVFTFIFRQQLKDFPSLADTIKADHLGTRETFTDWLEKANGVLSAAEKGTLNNLWLTRPWEYIKFIEETDQKQLESSALSTHIPKITLYGTMVGFAFLLPESLRNHACRAEGQFNTLRIIASDAQTKISNNSHNLADYPLWLACKLTLLLLKCSRFSSFLESGREFKIEICYLPHDIFTAVISLAPREIAVLQALDPTTFMRVLNENELQRGFRYVNEPNELDSYDRYKAVLSNINEMFSVNGDQQKKKRERWTFRSHAHEMSITINSPHWEWDGTRIKKILTQKEYDETPTNEIAVSGNSGIETFLNAFLTKLRNDDITGTTLATFEKIVEEKKKVWARRHHLECLCSSDT